MKFFINKVVINYARLGYILSIAKSYCNLSRNFSIIMIIVSVFLFSNCNNFDILLKDGKGLSSVENVDIWTDNDGDGEIDGETYLGAIIPYEGNLNAIDNYDYYHASTHIHVGPISEDYRSKVFLYNGSDGLYLMFYHNADETSNANDVDWTITIGGNNLKDDVVFSDDEGELTIASTDNVNKIQVYEGIWHYQNRSDGGIIGPLKKKGFSIQIDINDEGNITSTRFYSANGDSFNLTGGTKILF